MPNLLAHYGVQGPLSRATAPAVDLKWFLTGCVLPDVPWILQRAVRALVPGVADPYELRLYFAVQASLLFCLILAFGIAVVTTRPRTVFGVLGVNSLLHLVLDALQTKWGVGVHLLAPFDWTPWSVGLFWPESAVTVAITAAGLAFLVWMSQWNQPGSGLAATVESRGRWGLAALALLSYFVLPMAFMDDAEAAGAHYVAVLRDRDGRPGHYVELDRERYLDRPEGDLIRTFAGEEIHPRGVDLDTSTTVSLQGHFVAPDTVAVEALHRHRSGLRDLASYVALAVLLLVWGQALRRQLRPSDDAVRRPDGRR